MNLKALRIRKNLTQAQVAEKMGLSRASYTNMENGKRGIEASQITMLAEILECSTDEILGKKPSEFKRRGIKIPVLGYVRAGIPIEAIEDVLGEEEITPELAATGDFFALKIKGDSMFPTFVDGDTVIVRQQTDIESGEVGVILINGDEATVKKVKLLPDGIMLIPSNTNYDPMLFNREQIANFPVQVIGKVVELRRSF